MEVLPTHNQLGSDTMRAVEWAQGQQTTSWKCFSGNRMQLSGDLPLPSHFSSPQHSGLQENLFYVHSQLACDVESAPFSKLSLLAGRVNEGAAADQPIVNSPESQMVPRAVVSPPASPPVEVRPLEVVSSPELFQHLANQDPSISLIALEALEGSLSACARLMTSHSKAGGLRPLALHRCLRPLADAGVLRARLELFVQHHDSLMHQGCHADATQAAFSAGVRMVLRMHRVLLRTCMSSIQARRAAEAGDADSSASTHATVLEILQHTRPLREQVKCLGDLCWCHVDERREWAANEKVPMKWETGPFPAYAALLDHVHTELAVCTSTNAHMCRFLLTECMRPLLSQLFRWTHSADGTHSTCLSMLMQAHSQPGLDFNQTGAQHPLGLEEWPAHSIQLQLPTFLSSMHEVILLTGLQMRYLASLRQCAATMPVLVGSSLRQLQQASSLVALCVGEPSSGLDVFTDASDIGNGGGCMWATSIGWQWEAVQGAQAIARAGVAERQAAADAMLWDLQEMRRVEGDALLAAHAASLRQRQREATVREQQQAQAAHAAHMQRAALLRQRLLEIDSRREQRLAGEQEKQQEEQAVMQGWMWDRSIGDSIRLAAEVKQLMLQNTRVEQREARMAWRLQRWALHSARHQLMEKTKQEEGALMDHHKRRHAGAAMHAAADHTQASTAPESVVPSTQSCQLSLPGTFLLPSRTRGRAGGRGLPHASGRASVALLEPLVEDSESMWSATMAASDGLQHRAPARPPLWAWDGSRSSATSSVAGSMIAEEPQLQALPGSSITDHHSEAASHAAGSSYAASCAQAASHGDGEGRLDRESFSGAASSLASTGGASQRGSVFLAHSWSGSERAVPARSIFSGSSGAWNDHPALRSRPPHPAEEAPPALSCAASTSYKRSQGGQSTIATTASTSSLRKQWIPTPAAVDPPGAAEASKRPTSGSTSALGYVPPSVALAVFVHEPIYAQYRLTSRMCMRLARDELQLLRVTQVLHDVLLGGRTTVVNAVMDSIKHQLRMHREVRAARLHDDLQEAAAEPLSAHDTPGGDAPHGLQFGVVLEPARQVTAACVRHERGIDSDDELPSTPEPPLHRQGDASGAGAVPTMSWDDFELQSLDAVRVTCSLPAVLQMLIPASALRFHADVFTVLLRVRWATSQLQRLLLLLRKAARHQPAARRAPADSLKAAHRLRLTSEILQAAQHAASQFETHLYMEILQPACIRFKKKLSTDMDTRQCANSFIDFGAECALHCLLAADAQLPVVVANMLSLCQHASRTAADLLLHVAVERLDVCGGATFAEVAERVLDEEVWGQLQDVMESLQTRVEFVKERLPAVG